jgi:hypothetical protein
MFEPRTKQPGSVVSADVPEEADPGLYGDNLNDLVPWCGLGCITLFANFDWPACVGCRFAGDVFCCTLETDCCRVLCEDSHGWMKKYPNDWCMVYQESVNCGECKTCISAQVALCCFECRLGIPTNSALTTPWIVNCVGLTLWYQWSFPCSCFSSIGELKDETAPDIPWCSCCEDSSSQDPSDDPPFPFEISSSGGSSSRS